MKKLLLVLCLITVNFISAEEDTHVRFAGMVRAVEERPGSLRLSVAITEKKIIRLVTRQRNIKPFDLLSVEAERKRYKQFNYLQARVIRPYQPERISFQAPPEKFISRLVTVSGKIISGKVLSKGALCLLSFSKNRKTIKLVIFKRSLVKFRERRIRPAMYYPGKIIKATGHLGYYKRNPQIIIYSPEQVNIP